MSKLIENLRITPGPLQHAKEGEEWGIIDQDHNYICRCPVYPGNNNWAKNYPLIKSAPELLEALDAFISIIDSRKPGESSKPLTQEEMFKLIATTEKSIQLIEQKFGVKWEEVKGDSRIE
jgi:hypothetical protein